MITDWKGDLLKDKSLRAVFRVTRSFPKSRTNERIYIIAITVVGTIVLAWIMSSNIKDSQSSVKAAADIAFDLTVQILGFLIGGFAIFATVTDQKLMVRLAQSPMGDTGLSVFKYVFYNFLSVFFIYISTLGISVAIKILSDANIINPYKFLSQEWADTVVVLTNSVVFSILTGMIALSVVRLKSFIWNIYQGFLTFLMVGDLLDRQREEEKAREGDLHDAAQALSSARSNLGAEAAIALASNVPRRLWAAVRRIFRRTP